MTILVIGPLSAPKKSSRRRLSVAFSWPPSLLQYTPFILSWDRIKRLLEDFIHNHGIRLPETTSGAARMLSPPRHLHTSFSIISSTSSTDEARNSAETEKPGRRDFSNF